MGLVQQPLMGPTPMVGGAATIPTLPATKALWTKSERCLRSLFIFRPSAQRF
jgi:hypothetical protein